MLDAAVAVLAVFDETRTKGGTYSAVRKARLRGMPGVHIDPYTTRIWVGLPDLRKVA